MTDSPLTNKFEIAKKEARFYALAIFCGGLFFILLASYGFTSHYQSLTDSLFLASASEVSDIYQMLLVEVLPMGLMLLGLVSIAAGIVQSCVGESLLNRVEDVNSDSNDIYS